MRRAARSTILGLVFLTLSGAGFASDSPNVALTLDRLQVEADALTAADDAGGVAVFEPRSRRLTFWEEGRFARACQLPGKDDVDTLAIGGGHALLVGDVSSVTRLRVLDAAKCREVAAMGWFGEPIVRTSGGSDGWFLVTGRFGAPLKVSSLGVHLEPGAESPAFPPQSKSPNPGARSVLPIATSSDFWLVAKAAFRPFVWRRSESRWAPLDVPSCLRSEGFDVTGEENLRWLRAMAAEADEGDRPTIEALIKDAVAGKGGLGYIHAVAAAAAYGETLGFLVRSDRGARCTLHVLRPASGQFAKMPVSGWCPTFLALGRRSAWMKVRKRFSEVPLPKAFVGAAAVCR